MKKIIFFDLDNTLHSTKKKVIHPQTLQLLEELSANPDVILGLATGRGPSKVHLLGNLLDLFTYKVYINGAIAYKNDTLVYDNPIKIEAIETVLKLAKANDVSIGFVARDGEYLTVKNEDIDFGMKDFQHDFPPIDPDAYKKIPVYQMWLFSQDKKAVEKVSSQVNLNCYPWHHGGADLVNKDTNKVHAIEKLLENETDYLLVTVGDGHNDIKMIEHADVGIAMGNSGFAELKEKADHVAPHIDDDQLYNFFKEINLIS